MSILEQKISIKREKEFNHMVHIRMHPTVEDVTNNSTFKHIEGCRECEFLYKNKDMFKKLNEYINKNYIKKNNSCGEICELKFPNNNKFQKIYNPPKVVIVDIIGDMAKVAPMFRGSTLSSIYDTYLYSRGNDEYIESWNMFEYPLEYLDTCCEIKISEEEISEIKNKYSLSYDFTNNFYKLNKTIQKFYTMEDKVAKFCCFVRSTII